MDEKIPSYDDLLVAYEGAEEENALLTTALTGMIKLNTDLIANWEVLKPKLLVAKGHEGPLQNDIDAIGAALVIIKNKFGDLIKARKVN